MVRCHRLARWSLTLLARYTCPPRDLRNNPPGKPVAFGAAAFVWCSGKRNHLPGKPVAFRHVFPRLQQPPLERG